MPSTRQQAPTPEKAQGPRLMAGPETSCPKSRQASAGSVPGPATPLLSLSCGHNTHRRVGGCRLPASSSSSSGRASLRGCRSPTTTVALRLCSALRFCSASFMASISEEGGHRVSERGPRSARPWTSAAGGPGSQPAEPELGREPRVAGGRGCSPSNLLPLILETAMESQAWRDGLQADELPLRSPGP